MPLGGLLPYDEEEEDFELPVSPQFGDMTDLQEMGPDGDRDLMFGGDLLQRLARRKTKVPGGMPQVAGRPAGMSPFIEEEAPNMNAVRALMQGFNG